MSRYHSYLNSAKQILLQYNGEEPFSSFLKKFFATHKKYGSKDRKQISHLCYCCFRLGKAGMGLPGEDRILTGLFLCSDEPNEILASLKPEWNDMTGLSLKEKLSSVNCQLSSLFPWKDELSGGIEYEKFCKSFFIQPDLFLRLRPGKEETVKQKLRQEGIQFETISDTCLSLPNSSKIDEIIEADKEAVVQDYSSQRTGEVMPLSTGHRPLSFWDCCAGSGGKSIMAYDLSPAIELTVSDIRESILVNLKSRFKKAEIRNYHSFVCNLANPQLLIPDSKFTILNSPFSLIICDVPCTGSGTWSRTPEQLYFFNNQTIEQFSNLQKKIVSNAIPHLQPGGHMVYITCSVFKKENEELVDFMKEKFQLQLKQMELLKGYDKKADSMFIAVLQKPL